MEWVLFTVVAPLQVRLNLGLRSATQEYLDQNAWAWKDCY